MGMVHDGPIGLAALLVLSLRGNLLLLAEKRATQGQLCCDGAPFGGQ